MLLASLGALQLILGLAIGNAWHKAGVDWERALTEAPQHPAFLILSGLIACIGFVAVLAMPRYKMSLFLVTALVQGLIIDLPIFWFVVGLFSVWVVSLQLVGDT